MNKSSFALNSLIVVAVFYLLAVGEALLLPFVIAVALWYLINTLSNAIERLSLFGLRVKPILARVAALLVFISMIWALVKFFGGRVDQVLEIFPLYQANLIARLEALPFLDKTLTEDPEMYLSVTEWINLPVLAASVAASFAGILASSGLIMIYILFLFLEQGNFDAKITELSGAIGSDGNARKIIERIRSDIEKYITIKLATSSLTGVVSYVFLVLVGVDFPGVWGLLIFLLNFIPTVGSIIATIFPALIALAQSDGYTLFLLVLAGIGILQIIIGNILEPRLMGSSFNLSPIVILLNLGLWSYIWGIPGMFLCVPFLIILTIVLSYFPQTRYVAIILSSDGKLRAPPEEMIDGLNLNPLLNDPSAISEKSEG